MTNQHDLSIDDLRRHTLRIQFDLLRSRAHFRDVKNELRDVRGRAEDHSIGARERDAARLQRFGLLLDRHPVKGSRLRRVGLLSLSPKHGRR